MRVDEQVSVRKRNASCGVPRGASKGNRSSSSIKPMRPTTQVLGLDENCDNAPRKVAFDTYTSVCQSF